MDRALLQSQAQGGSLARANVEEVWGNTPSASCSIFDSSSLRSGGLRGIGGSMADSVFRTGHQQVPTLGSPSALVSRSLTRPEGISSWPCHSSPSGLHVGCTLPQSIFEAQEFGLPPTESTLGATPVAPYPSNPNAWTGYGWGTSSRVGTGSQTNSSEGTCGQSTTAPSEWPAAEDATYDVAGALKSGGMTSCRQSGFRPLSRNSLDLAPELLSYSLMKEAASAGQTFPTQATPTIGCGRDSSMCAPKRRDLLLAKANLFHMNVTTKLAVLGQAAGHMNSIPPSGIPVSRHFDPRRISPFDLSKFDRRDPYSYFYIPVDCPFGRRCADGMCPLAHTKLEKIFHPIVYKTQRCQMVSKTRCEYLHKCAFFHTDEDRQEAELHWKIWEADWIPWRQQIDQLLLRHQKLEKEIRRKVEGIIKIRMPRSGVTGSHGVFFADGSINGEDCQPIRESVKSQKYSAMDRSFSQNQTSVPCWCSSEGTDAATVADTTLSQAETDEATPQMLDILLSSSSKHPFPHNAPRSTNIKDSSIRLTDHLVAANQQVLQQPWLSGGGALRQHQLYDRDNLLNVPIPQRGGASCHCLFRGTSDSSILGSNNHSPNMSWVSGPQFGDSTEDVSHGGSVGVEAETESDAKSGFFDEEGRCSLPREPFMSSFSTSVTTSGSLGGADAATPAASFPRNQQAAVTHPVLCGQAEITHLSRQSRVALDSQTNELPAHKHDYVQPQGDYSSGKYIVTKALNMLSRSSRPRMYGPELNRSPPSNSLSRGFQDTAEPGEKAAACDEQPQHLSGGATFPFEAEDASHWVYSGSSDRRRGGARDQLQPFSSCQHSAAMAGKNTAAHEQQCRRHNMTTSLERLSARPQQDILKGGSNNFAMEKAQIAARHVGNVHSGYTWQLTDEDPHDVSVRSIERTAHMGLYQLRKGKRLMVPRTGEHRAGIQTFEEGSWTAEQCPVDQHQCHVEALRSISSPTNAPFASPRGNAVYNIGVEESNTQDIAFADCYTSDKSTILTSGAEQPIDTMNSVAGGCRNANLFTVPEDSQVCSNGMQHDEPVGPSDFQQRKFPKGGMHVQEGAWNSPTQFTKKVTKPPVGGQVPPHYSGGGVDACNNQRRGEGEACMSEDEIHVLTRNLNNLLRVAADGLRRLEIIGNSGAAEGATGQHALRTSVNPIRGQYMASECSDIQDKSDWRAEPSCRSRIHLGRRTSPKEGRPLRGQSRSSSPMEKIRSAHKLYMDDGIRTIGVTREAQRVPIGGEASGNGECRGVVGKPTTEAGVFRSPRSFSTGPF